MLLELNGHASLHLRLLTSEPIPDRGLRLLCVVGIASVLPCVPVAGPSTASSVVILS